MTNIKENIKTMKEKNNTFFPKGYIHIYKGDGKGKTSILNGIAVRALGYGIRMKYLRFLKNRESGEILFFQKTTKELEIENFYHFSNKFI
jgi:cob(I)alamin adenosyltransferase